MTGQLEDDIQQKGQSHRLMEKACTEMCMYYNVLYMYYVYALNVLVCTIMCMYYKPPVLYGRKSLPGN